MIESPSLRSLIEQWRKRAADTLDAIPPWSPHPQAGAELHKLHAKGRAEADTRCADELEAALASSRAPQAPEHERLAAVCRRLAETQRNMPVPLSIAERADLRLAAVALRELPAVPRAPVPAQEPEEWSRLLVKVKNYWVDRAEKAEAELAALRSPQAQLDPKYTTCPHCGYVEGHRADCDYERFKAQAQEPKV